MTIPGFGYERQIHSQTKRNSIQVGGAQHHRFFYNQVIGLLRWFGFNCYSLLVVSTTGTDQPPYLV